MTVESRSVVVRLSMEAAQYIRDAQKVGTVTADAMSKVEKSAMSASKAQDQLADGAGKVGLAAAVGVGVVVNAAAGFDQAMSKVQAATHETASGMQSLREAALEAGADTAFSAEEAAAGIENLAKAGLSTQDILDGGLTGALDLAAAGNMEVADAAEAAAGALAQFKLEGDQASHVADLLAAGAGKAQGDVSDMVMALKQAGTVSAQTGLSLEETVGSLSAMAEQSLLGSDAGTSFKTMLAALTPNSKKAADAMEAYNIQAFDAEGRFVGMTALAGQLQAGLSGLTDEQRAMALETIFGSDAVRAASIIYDNGAEGIANWTAKVNDAGYAAETASIMQDNLRGDIEKLGGALSTALIQSGEGSQGFLRSLTQGLTGAVDAYGQMPSTVQNTVTALMTGAAAVGGSIWVGSKLVQGINNTREAFDALDTSGSRASRMMRNLAVAGTAAIAVEALAGSVVTLANSLDESLPGLEVLKGRLLDMQELGGKGFSVTLGAEFDSLGDSIDRITAKTDDQRLDDGLASFFNAITPGDGRTKALREATAEVEALDAALASLVADAGPDVAEQVLGSLVEQGYMSEAQLKRVRGELDQYDEAVASAANQAKTEEAAARDAADATSELGGSLDGAAEKAEDFGDTLDGLNEKLAGRADMRDYEAALDDFTKSLKDNGKTFDINTQKGRENQAALDNIASSALNVAENMGKTERKRFLTGAIEDIRTMGKSMKLPQSEIQRLIGLLREASDADVKPKIDADPAELRQKVEDAKDRLDELGSMKPSPKVDAQTAAAEAKLNNLLAMLREAERDRASTVTTTFVTNRVPGTGFGPVREANGGVLDFYADGGMTENHVAQIAPAGTWRVWAEPETGGEAYIPLAESKRARSIDIWEQVGARLGVEFERFADGSAGGGKTDGKKKRKRTFNGEQTEWVGGPSEEDIAQAAMQAADAAEMYYAEQERAQRQAEERADEAAQAAEDAADRQREYDEAVLEGQQRAWDEMTDAANAQKDAAQEMVDSVKANMDKLGQAATAQFQSDLFSPRQSGLSAAGFGSGWRGALEGDIAGLTERGSLIAQLSAPGLGLSPEALEALMGADNTQIRDMLAAGEVDDYAAMFAERARLTGVVSGQAGMAGYGGEWTAANAELARANGYLEQLVAIIAGARPITVNESVSAGATAAEIARVQALLGF